MTMTIRVSKEDIAEGTRNSCLDCPVARAIAEYEDFPCFEVGIARDGISFAKETFEYGDDLEILSTDMKHYKADTPKVVRKFIKRFDKGRKVKPFSFLLEARAYNPV